MTIEIDFIMESKMYGLPCGDARFHMTLGATDLAEPQK